jgi:hypothetical protein
MPASNFEAGRAGHIALGQEKANQVIVFDGLMDSNSLFLTGNAGGRRGPFIAKLLGQENREHL